MFNSLPARILTLPYACALWLRHKCYDYGLFKSVTPDIPTISIGNITVGGTGKTPHTELVLRLFLRHLPIAVLSRGYKRRSKGFRYVMPEDHFSETGDEPLQIKRKFPAAVVAVDKNRISGIERIRKEHPEVQLIVLDDAFQYRQLKPSVSILLSDYSRPFTRDLLLPFGRLRDLPSQASRAEIIIVSKTPPDVSPIDRQVQQKGLQPKSCQQLLFSCYRYENPKPLFPETQRPGNEPPKQVIALTGIANPAPFLRQIEERSELVEHLKFPDHHAFTAEDACHINKLAASHPGIPIYTTEKDAIRLSALAELTPQTREQLFYVPIQADFCRQEEQSEFIRRIRELVCRPDV